MHPSPLTSTLATVVVIFWVALFLAPLFELLWNVLMKDTVAEMCDVLFRRWLPRLLITWTGMFVIAGAIQAALGICDVHSCSETYINGNLFFDALFMGHLLYQYL